MDITPSIPQNRQLITGYGNDGFKINNEFIAGSLLVFSEKTMSWEIGASEDFSLDHFEGLIRRADEIELVLIGTGQTMRPIPPAIHSHLKAHNIAVESMDTGAACRTFNVLMSEGRHVAAALIAV
ncbi:MAG: Mth938-like domain-containing protein [Rickettsiales bacterium]